MKIEDFFKDQLLDDMETLNKEIQASQDNVGNITYEQSLELAKTLLISKIISKHMENLEKLTNQTNEYLRNISDALDDLAEDLDVD